MKRPRKTTRDTTKQPLVKSSKMKTRASLGFVLDDIAPLTYTQGQVFEAFFENHLLLHGLAGTGKTFVSLYLALREMFEHGNYKKIVIIRSAVPTRDLGFMPGSLDEKLSVYEAPYKEITNNLFGGRGDAYDILKQKNFMEFMSTSFIRGLTINNSIIIVDEIQNMNFGELDSIITRVGDNSKIIFCGDFRQTDLRTARDRQGLTDFMKILDEMKAFEHIEFLETDIVRGSLVKNYIITKNHLDIHA